MKARPHRQAASGAARAVLLQELLLILFRQSDMVATAAALDARVRLLMQSPPRGTSRKAIAAAARPVFEMLQL
jgi:hypothetical protein